MANDFMCPPFVCVFHLGREWHFHRFILARVAGGHFDIGQPDLAKVVGGYSAGTGATMAHPDAQARSNEPCANAASSFRHREVAMDPVGKALWFIESHF